MRHQGLVHIGWAGMLLALAGCADKAALPPEASVGPVPTLPPPDKALIPIVDIAPAKQWPAGVTPRPAAGLEVKAMATGLDHPRWLYVLPNGDVLVAESNAPPRPEDGKGIKGFIMKKVMKKAGAAVPSANRISLLRDADGDGVAEMKTAFMTGLNSPFGMALIGQTLYVANTDGIVSVPYQSGATTITTAPQAVVPLPGGPLNHHWTKNIIASKDGSKLYATVGSNSNVAENGMDKEVNRAAILEVDLATKKTRLFASGLRNPNGMGWEPTSGALWTVVNERDELGSDLVPDYLTSVKDGAFYGWPYSYYGKHVDQRVKPPRPDLVATALSPDYALGNHVAPLGMVFYEGAMLPATYRGGAFIGQHGSWNRTPLSGYNVVFVPFANGMPRGKPIEVLGGFVNEEGDAYGRPVGVAVDKAGALLVADDVGNVVWRVTPAGGAVPAAAAPATASPAPVQQQ
ncbi:sorbosone dehydrogenase family protein [Massilia sp. PAMC28688]|uniref:PQQ-dependent sugar dehydrogenase n=1 Tax=Massilia sp. PAMC28688 TaxID=2861283 RepID=UPI001C633DEA|nr:sorbosone dehydrogenase family protein [Massilia sp. PAMC28688]QYF95789.1 sorbosone dehydrogenase family protein [Massilia sp. PAMC28688]